MKKEIRRTNRRIDNSTWRTNDDETKINIHVDRNVYGKKNRRTQKESMGKHHVAKDIEVTKRKKKEKTTAKYLDIASRGIIKKRQKGLHVIKLC